MKSDPKAAVSVILINIINEYEIEQFEKKLE